MKENLPPKDSIAWKIHHISKLVGWVIIVGLTLGSLIFVLYSSTNPPKILNHYKDSHDISSPNEPINTGDTIPALIPRIINLTTSKIINTNTHPNAIDTDETIKTRNEINLNKVDSAIENQVAITDGDNDDSNHQFGLTETDKIWLNLPSTIPNFNSKNVEIDSNTDSEMDKCGLNKQVLIWVGHHKTGSKAFFLMSKFIGDYCFSNITTRHYVYNKYSGYFVYWWICTRGRLLSTIQSIVNHHKTKFNNSQLKIHYANMMRDPVSVILSGFNYHSTDPYDRSDRWLGNAMKGAQNFKCIFDNNHITMINNFGVKLGLTKDFLFTKRDMSVNSFYIEMLERSKNENIIYLEFVLYIEYHRWLCDEWTESFDSFNLINEIEINGKFKDNIDKINIDKDNVNVTTPTKKHPAKGKEFKDKFGNLFESAVNVKFEYFWHFPNLDIIDPTVGENLRKLQNFDKSSMKLLNTIPSLKQTNANAYVEIAKLIKNTDIHNLTTQQLAKNKHVTSNKVNKTLQVHSLLKHEETCLELKERSRILDYYWLYPQFC